MYNFEPYKPTRKYLHPQLIYNYITHKLWSFSNAVEYMRVKWYQRNEIRMLHSKKKFGTIAIINILSIVSFFQ